MAIFVAVKLAPHLLPQISVAAYSYMALMPLIQPPVMRLLTARGAPDQDGADARKSPGWRRSLSRWSLPFIVNMFFPPVAPLITMLMLGNLLKEVGVTDAWPRPPARADERHHHHPDGGHRLDDVRRHFLTVRRSRSLSSVCWPSSSAPAPAVVTAKIMNLFLKTRSIR